MNKQKKRLRCIITMTLAFTLIVGQLYNTGSVSKAQEENFNKPYFNYDDYYYASIAYSNAISGGPYTITIDKDGILTVKVCEHEDFSLKCDENGFPLPFTLYFNLLGENAMPLDWEQNRDKITKVVWDSKILTIPAGAFAVTKITSFKVSDNVTYIGSNAFSSESIKSVILGANVKTIDKQAFMQSGLTSIAIPASVTEIGDDVLKWCDDLAQITVESGNTRYSSKNSNVIYDNNNDRIIAACKNSKVPQGTKIIGKSVFSNSPITTLDLPYSLKTIEDYAFQNASLTTLNLPCSLKTIEDYAFYGTSLTSIKIPEGVEAIGTSAFENCKNLKSVYLPTGVKLEDKAFAYNDNLTDIYYAGTEAGWGITSGNSHYDINSDGSTRNVKMHYNYKYTTHNWDDGVITTEPTTTAEGVKTYTCNDCKETRTERIPKLEDNTKPTEPTEPTEPKDTHGPNTGAGAYPFIQIYDGSQVSTIFSTVENTQTVDGLSYDRNTNTLTMNNYTGGTISANEMGDDFTINVVGTNNISNLTVWGFGYCGSVKITGNGILNINNTTKTGIELKAENSKSQLYIDKGVTVNISCGTNAVHVSESTHDTPIKFADGVTASNDKITTTAAYMPAISDFMYACSKNGTSYSFWYPYGNETDGYSIRIFDATFTLVDSIPWDGLSVPTEAVEKAGYTVSYSTSKVNYADIAAKTLTIKPAASSEVKPGEKPEEKPENKPEVKPVSVPKASILKVKGAKKAVTVTAKKISGAKGYQIRYATNKKMSGAKSTLSASASKKITRLKAKKKYYIQVRAYKLDANNKKVFGAWSSVKTVKTK